MKKFLFLSTILLIAQYSFAALPPQYQNIKDIDIMVDYIKKNEEVASTLESIDFLQYVIYYGNGCKAVFGRKSTLKPLGWVGPAEQLEFKKIICPVE
ncbi:MAG: hypothetical protein AB7F61_19105 [Desulfobulbus sp.]